MPLDQAEAIVLRTSPIGDQDKLCSFLTRDKGVLRGVAKGARKFGNRFGSSLEPMSHVRVFFYEKERRDLVTISACDLLESFFDIQTDLQAALTPAYFAELVEEFVPGPGPRGRRLPPPPGRAPGPRRTRRLGPPDPLLRGLVAPGQRHPARRQRCKKCRKAVAEADAPGCRPGGTGSTAATAPRSARRRSAASWPCSCAGPGAIRRPGAGRAVRARPS